MIKITREEAEYLRSRGRDNDIHISSATKNSRGKRYYVTQSRNTMQLLNKYRRASTKTTYG